MFELDYQELISQKQVCFFKYGRGGVLAVTNISMEEFSVSNLLSDEHSQEPIVLTDIHFDGDFLEITYEIESRSYGVGFYQVDSNKNNLVKRRMLISEITFESYQINTDEPC